MDHFALRGIVECAAGRKRCVMRKKKGNLPFFFALLSISGKDDILKNGKRCTACFQPCFRRNDR